MPTQKIWDVCSNDKSFVGTHVMHRWISGHPGILIQRLSCTTCSKSHGSWWHSWKHLMNADEDRQDMLMNSSVDSTSALLWAMEHKHYSWWLMIVSATTQLWYSAQATPQFFSLRAMSTCSSNNWNCKVQNRSGHRPCYGHISNFKNIFCFQTDCKVTTTDSSHGSSLPEGLTLQ